jgi:hypothetical protein
MAQDTQEKKALPKYTKTVQRWFPVEIAEERRKKNQ